MKEALTKIAQMSDCGSPELTILRMKQIALNELDKLKYTQPKEQVADEQIEALAIKFTEWVNKDSWELDFRETKSHSIQEQFDYFIANVYKGYKASPLHNEGWISVEDKEPPKAEPILIFNGHWIGVGYYKKNFALNIDGEPDWCDETTEYIEPSATHWQPLPPNPINK